MAHPYPRIQTQTGEFSPSPSLSLRDAAPGVIPAPDPAGEIPPAHGAAGPAASARVSPAQQRLREPLPGQVPLLQPHPDTRWASLLPHLPEFGWFRENSLGNGGAGAPSVLGVWNQGR